MSWKNRGLVGVAIGKRCVGVCVKGCDRVVVKGCGWAVVKWRGWAVVMVARVVRQQVHFGPSDIWVADVGLGDGYRAHDCIASAIHDTMLRWCERVWICIGNNFYCNGHCTMRNTRKVSLDSKFM